jgi:hypothetical protein
MLIDVNLRRVVLASGTDHQYIYLQERGGGRSFPIMIGNTEANEIHRVVHGQTAARPLTHQLTQAMVEGLGGRIVGVDIVDLKQNTFFAQIRLEGPGGEVHVDARPSDAIALALRAQAPLRAEEHVIEAAGESA